MIWTLTFGKLFVAIAGSGLSAALLTATTLSEAVPAEDIPIARWLEGY
jgi:hypothetical protein